MEIPSILMKKKYCILQIVRKVNKFNVTIIDKNKEIVIKYNSI